MATLVSIYPRTPWQRGSSPLGTYLRPCLWPHRNLTSPWISPGCPHWRGRLLARTACDWTEVPLCPGLSSPSLWTAHSVWDETQVSDCSHPSFSSGSPVFTDSRGMFEDTLNLNYSWQFIYMNNLGWLFGFQGSIWELKITPSLFMAKNKGFDNQKF